ncbi:hypothetical protein GCM10010201_01130 [Pilimelia columellifera subsp. columellifera]|uniref:Uncharacterized protein n=1 Tax=Pilimelia columellifera subsp. columellifera TaxID=706583 RepID=A0ABP6A489_9ACTN
MAALWVTWATGTWWEIPREASRDTARGDIAAGRVAEVVRADGWNDGDGIWFNNPSARLSADGVYLVWTTFSGQVRYTLDGRPAAGLGGSVSDTTDPPTTALEAGLRAAARQATEDRSSTRWSVPGIAGGALWLAFLMILAAGPAPRQGTRVFWFWVGLASFGLGVLAWLGTERPWAGLAGPARRRSGWLGLGYLIVSTIVVGVLTLGLRLVSGGTLVPG